MSEKFNFGDLPEVENDDFPQEKTNLTGSKSTESRLCAVQALYQVIMVGLDVNNVLDSFVEHEIPHRKCDKKLFKKIIAAVAEQQTSYEETIAKQLQDSWTLETINPVARSLLLAAVTEKYVVNTPDKVIINEYLNISKGFLNEEEQSFLNGVLDRLFKALD